MAAVAGRLTRRFGRAAAIRSEIDPMVVATSEDVRLAERRLLRRLVKDTDGFMARHFDRHISLQISRRLAPTAVKPTQITLVSIAIGLCGAPFFLSSHWSWQTVGALLFLLHSIVDGCDGELARLKFQESRYGGILDFWGDNVVHVAVFGCMAIGWALSGRDVPLWLGAAAIVGTLGSAGFVYCDSCVKEAAAHFTRGFDRSRRSSGLDARCGVTPRLHLSADPCAVRQGELASAFGCGRSADILSTSDLLQVRAVATQTDQIGT